jgi:hypothetical protein
LSDFAVAHDIDWFGTKTGQDDNRIPFGVKIYSGQHRVYITVANGLHGASIAGSLAANRLTGGLYDGAAPSAQLIDGRSNPYLTELATVLQLAERKDVSVISRAGGFARAGYTGLAEGK